MFWPEQTYSYLCGGRYPAAGEVQLRASQADYRWYATRDLKRLGQSPKKESSRFPWAIARVSAQHLKRFLPTTRFALLCPSVAALPIISISHGGPLQNNM